jgi:hypothetical protein
MSPEIPVRGCVQALPTRKSSAIRLLCALWVVRDARARAWKDASDSGAAAPRCLCNVLVSGQLLWHEVHLMAGEGVILVS